MDLTLLISELHFFLIVSFASSTTGSNTEKQQKLFLFENIKVHIACNGFGA